MKLSHLLIAGCWSITRLHALESAEVAAAIKGFDNPSGDEQYKARMELNRLVAQASVPGKGDPATVARILISVLEDKGTSVESRKYLIRSLARLGSADALDPLVKVMGGDDAMLREEARQAISNIHSPLAAGVLENALRKSTDKRASIGLIDALANIKSGTSVSVLAPFILNPDLDTASAALTAIARIGGANAASTLGKAYASSKLAPQLKGHAGKSLLIASAGDPKIAANLYQNSTLDSVKLAAFLAATKAPDGSTQSALVESALKSEDPDLRYAALACGMELNLPSLHSTLAQPLDAIPFEDRMIILANLHLLKPPAAAEKVALARLKSTDEEERIGAITALGNLGTKPAFDAVLKEIGAREPRVNQAASNALAGMPYADAEATLLRLLKAPSGPEKLLAIKAMASRQVDGGSTALVELIRSGDAETAKEAMKTLYFIASIDDLGRLCAAATTTEDQNLRGSLVSICNRIATRLKTPEASGLVKDLK